GGALLPRLSGALLNRPGGHPTVNKIIIVIHLLFSSPSLFPLPGQVGLRQLDMSLLCQLYSLYESIQEYKGACQADSNADYVPRNSESRVLQGASPGERKQAGAVWQTGDVSPRKAS
uniref:Protein FAM89A n=1 Tax=Apteryx owenii TaxID=8824 RepID=A0A8B9PZK9_APTOW